MRNATAVLKIDAVRWPSRYDAGRCDARPPVEDDARRRDTRGEIVPIARWNGEEKTLWIVVISLTLSGVTYVCPSSVPLFRIIWQNRP